MLLLSLSLRKGTEAVIVQREKEKHVIVMLIMLLEDT